MKKLLALCLLLTAALGLGACGSSDSASKEEIFDLVTSQQDLLLDAIARETYTEVRQLDGLTDIYTEDTYLDFSFSWEGFASQTNSIGFYYVETDDPADIFPDDLSQSGDGWLWEDPDSDNHCYLEKICDCFYYYELSL